MVPGLDVRNAEPEADAAVLNSLALFAARRWTPRAGVSGADGLWLDLTGVSHLFGGEAALCARILRFCARAGYRARIAVAATPGAAHALARFGRERMSFCTADEVGLALAPLPLAALRIDEEVLAAARKLGIERIGELMTMPRGPLAKRFGGSLLLRLDQALGRAGEAFTPVVPEEPPVATLRLLEPITTAEAIAQVTGDLMTALIGMLEQQGLAARQLTLLCDRVDGAVQRLAIGTAKGTRDARHLLHLLGQKLDRIEPGFGIEAMHLVAGRCEPWGPQPLPGELTEAPPPPDLSTLVDRIASRIGFERVYRVSDVESDVPERCTRRVPALTEPVHLPARWPRPARLLPRPEPVSNVVALLPDQPPRRFTWRGQAYQVRKADGPERIYGEWWKRSAEATAVRDYFQVEDEEGHRYWMFRRGDGVDPRTGDMSWWLQGLFG
jgi:protein ImuB